MEFLKKNWSNLLLLLVILLLILPQTRRPLQVAMNRLLAFAPTELEQKDRMEIRSFDWRLRSLDGIPANLLTSGGKVTVVNLWATWCPPCIAEMPAFQKLYDTYGNQVDFYFVSQEKEEQLRDFLKRKGYDLPVYIPLETAPTALQSDRFPTTFVISREKEIVVKKTGAADWNDPEFRRLLERLLGR